jgi:hypothetical protein
MKATKREMKEIFENFYLCIKYACYWLQKIKNEKKLKYTLKI